MEGKTQETAAAKAGMSVRSARKWQSGPLPSQAKPEHRWRTRGSSNGGGAVTPQQWEHLAKMDDRQLRQWVMAGRTMARSGRDSPVDNAIRWVEENRVESSEPPPR